MISVIIWGRTAPSNHHWLVNLLAFRQIASDDPCHALSERELRDNSHSTLATVNHDVSDGSVIIMAPSQNCFKRAVCSLSISSVLIAGGGRWCNAWIVDHARCVGEITHRLKILIHIYLHLVLVIPARFPTSDLFFSVEWTSHKRSRLYDTESKI